MKYKKSAYPKVLLLALMSLSMSAPKVVMGQKTVGPKPAFSVAGFYPQSDSPRKVYNFNPGWRFFKGNIKGAEQVGFNDSAWAQVSLPDGLEILPENASGMRNYQGPAWYRKTFKTASTNGKSFIYFEGVMGKAVVYLNGIKVKEHFGGYLPFVVDIDNSTLTKNGNNVIAVLADNSNDESYPPGKAQDNLDFAYLGGIYRDVYWIETPSLHLSFPELSKTIAGGGVFVAVKDVNGNSANIEVRTEVQNEGNADVKLSVRSTLEDRDGKVILTKTGTLKVIKGGSQQMIQQLDVKNVHLWHPDDPYLHFIKTEVLENGKVVDSYRTRFGIRLFEMRGDDGFFVNKKYIGHKLSGVNRHQDYVYVGNAVPNTSQYRDAKLLREAGSTIVRAAHYPLDPAFMDACDELGLLVTSANPGWQFYNDKDPRFEKFLAEDTHNLVRRDRNRAALLLWETAINETPWQPASVMNNLHRIVHQEFPYPGAFTAADVDEAKKAGFDFYYHGGMQEEKNSFTREYGDGGEVDNFYSQNAMSRVKREWGELALLNQANIRAQGLNEIFNTPPKRIGAALWAGIDHQRGYHPDPFLGGLLDVYRMPRYSFYLFKSQYDPSFKLPGIETGPMVYIAHELTQVSGGDITVFSNCEEVRLTWLGKVIGTVRPDSTMKNMPHAPFVFKNVFNFHEISTNWRNKTKEINLIAEGLIGGKVVVSSVKKYPERTTGIKLDIDSAGLGLYADGSDFIPVRATIVDNNGVAKVLASENVHFEVEGEGTVIGSEENQANPMKTQFGTATVLVRATTRAGKIKVKAYVNGLKADEITFNSIPAALPLLFSDQSKPIAKNPGPISKLGQDTGNQKKSAEMGEVKDLKDRIKRLELEVTSRDQDIMELRSKKDSKH
ncbi:beta-galactosidase [Pedobacter sp. HMWF019]|uniref:glycoside hydrolase family 2 TIM barrel-domain containing protein n=1 Tax=Pedobacter sp. HMWF019 TaxID=2056856 RepID=UPI000D3A1159|nr:glycoside hydrolase family 2 TIM barrel-domain containing protein [Pedobacter sp. HMWF019]PTT00757.1 beta-galactosidase [Pedobacter sp. HMWF019]